MFIRIETSSGLPITRQIADQIRAQCAAGSLQPGDRLPSVRELARDLAVNHNTILRVYERLTVEGLLERRQGDGTFVSARLPIKPMRQPRRQLEQQVAHLVELAGNLGVPPDELRQLVEQALTRAQSPDQPTPSGERTWTSPPSKSNP